MCEFKIVGTASTIVSKGVDLYLRAGIHPIGETGEGTIDLSENIVGAGTIRVVGGYATLTGTSQATPVVAGIIHARGAAPVSGGGGEWRRG